MNAEHCFYECRTLLPFMQNFEAASLLHSCPYIIVYIIWNE